MASATKSANSLRTRLFVWYLSSLIVLAIFFYLVVHIWMLPYSTEMFFLLLFILAISGFFIIRRITQSLINLTGQIKNITDRNLETRIKGIGSEDEMGELAQAFNDLLERLNKAFIRERQFIADVAHELKTPLATQRSGLEITLRQNRSAGEYRQAVADAVTENSRLSATLQNVLDLAWSEAPNEQNRTTKFNISQLMEDLCEIAIKMAQAKKITVNHSIKKNIDVSGFKDKLAMAILNIIDNAIKYTPPGGKITINLTKNKHGVKIIIADTGCGIAKKDLPHIFDRFYRGAATDNVKGSGLGLAISKSVINLHHGNIQVKSRAGKGTVFIILINFS